MTKYIPQDQVEQIVDQKLEEKTKKARRRRWIKRIIYLGIFLALGFIVWRVWVHWNPGSATENPSNTAGVINIEADPDITNATITDASTANTDDKGNANEEVNKNPVSNLPESDRERPDGESLQSWRVKDAFVNSFLEKQWENIQTTASQTGYPKSTVTAIGIAYCEKNPDITQWRLGHYVGQYQTTGVHKQMVSKIIHTFQLHQLLDETDLGATNEIAQMPQYKNGGKEGSGHSNTSSRRSSKNNSVKSVGSQVKVGDATATPPRVTPMDGRVLEIRQQKAKVEPSAVNAFEVSDVGPKRTN